MGNNITANQHYVPQAHLRLFGDEQERLWVYDKPTLRKFGPVDVSKIASERFFYEFDADLKDRASATFQATEKALSKIESEYMTLITAVIDRVLRATPTIDVVLTSQERLDIAVYLLLQLGRTKEAREDIRELSNKIQAEIVSSLGGIPNDQRLDDDYIKWLQLRDMLLSSTELGPFICNRIWIFGANRSDADLWISDHPVVREVPRDRNVMPPRGLATHGEKLLFPLSSRVLLLVCDPLAHSEYAKFDGTVVPLNATNVLAANEMQIRQSHRQVYSASPDMVFAEKLSREYPTIRSLERERYVKVTE